MKQEINKVRLREFKNIYFMKTQNTLKSLGFFCLMIFAFMTNEVNAQSTERTVTGTVKSLDGPVPFATIMLKGSAIGISADEKGVFTFPRKLKENDVLVVTSLGYKDDFIKIKKDSTEINAFLEDIPIVIVAALRTSPSKTTQETAIH